MNNDLEIWNDFCRYYNTKILNNLSDDARNLLKRLISNDVKFVGLKAIITNYFKPIVWYKYKYLNNIYSLSEHYSKKYDKHIYIFGERHGAIQFCFDIENAIKIFDINDKDAKYLLSKDTFYIINNIKNLEISDKIKYLLYVITRLGYYENKIEAENSYEFTFKYLDIYEFIDKELPDDIQKKLSEFYDKVKKFKNISNSIDCISLFRYSSR
jgi:hypothetical protein